MTHTSSYSVTIQLPELASRWIRRLPQTEGSFGCAVAVRPVGSRQDLPPQFALCDGEKPLIC